MIESLGAIALLLVFCSVVCLIVGLINPAAFRWLFRRNLSRKQTGLVFGGTTFGFFVIICILAVLSPTSSNSTNSKVIPTAMPSVEGSVQQQKQSSISAQTDSKPTPAPTVSCIEFINNADRYHQCLQDQQPPKQLLNADVQVSNQYLVVTNKDDVKWTGCDYSIDFDTSPNDFYELGGLFGGPYSIIKPHQTLEIPWGQLTKNDGTRYNYSEQAPTDLIIDCTADNQGKQWSNYK